MSVALYVLALLLVLAGIAGTILPALPGAPLVLAGLVAAAWADGFARVGALPLVLCGLLAAATLVVDVAATALGARRVGASPWALLGAAVGSLVGLLFGIPGLFLGPFVGAAVGEAIAVRDLRRAGVVGFGTWVGIVLGSLAKLAIVLAMLGIFAVAWVF